MAQSIIAQPQSFTPAYNPVKFIVDSTNKNLDGFKYIYDVYNGATLIGRFKVLPTYGTGFGELDLSRFLNSYVQWDFNPTNTTDYDAANSYYNYEVKTGEEYLAQFNYTAALTNSSGFVRVNVTNTFAVGDQVNITQADGGVANPLLEGLHSVTAATGSYFEVGVSFTSITNVNIDGSVVYADQRKLVTYDITDFDVKRVFNGARTFVEFPTFDETTYLPNGVTKLWLTNQPQTQFYATLGQDLWINIRGRIGKKIVFENSNGDIFTKVLTNNTTIQGVAVGPNNAGVLNVNAGTLPLVKPDTTYYYFWYDDGGQSSVKYRVYIDRRVSISEHNLVFLDRMGSWSSFAFQLKAYERGEVQRDDYNKDVQGYVSGGQWNYNYQEFGFSTFNINVVKTLELNTNWMTETMAQYFEELVTSPQVFIKSVSYDCDDVASTNYLPVIVTNNTFEVFKQRNKNLIKQTLVVKLANNDAING